MKCLNSFVEEGGLEGETGLGEDVLDGLFDSFFLGASEEKKTLLVKEEINFLNVKLADAKLSVKEKKKRL